MAKWQITLTTIYCEAIGEEVTIIVQKDLSVKCTGHLKYHAANGQIANPARKNNNHLTRQLRCEGLECQRVTQYREKLSAEGGLKGGLPLSEEK